nr:hypothetical protein Iba_chr06cCG3170 [Ipomoea batatas]
MAEPPVAPPRKKIPVTSKEKAIGDQFETETKGDLNLETDVNRAENEKSDGNLEPVEDCDQEKQGKFDQDESERAKIHIKEGRLSHPALKRE